MWCGTLFAAPCLARVAGYYHNSVWRARTPEQRAPSRNEAYKVITALAIKARSASSAGADTPADDVLNYREVDAPARAQPDGSVEFPDTENSVPDAQRDTCVPAPSASA
jgi:hypothetical protein